MLSNERVKELWASLDEMGEEQVRIKYLRGDYGAHKRPFVQDWLRRHQSDEEDASSTAPTESTTTIFLSHAGLDEELALYLEETMETRFPDSRVFVSSNRADIPLGLDWMKEIRDALDAAQICLILITSRSIDRPWVWLETGVAWGARRVTIPMCIGEPRKDSVPRPLSDFQGMNLGDADDMTDLLTRIADVMGFELPEFDAEEIAQRCIDLDHEISKRLPSSQGEPTAEQRISSPPQLTLRTERVVLSHVSFLHPLQLVNAENHSVQITFKEISINQGLPQDINADAIRSIVNEVDGRFKDKVLTLLPGDPLELHPDIDVKFMQYLTVKFSYQDEMGNEREDVITGY